MRRETISKMIENEKSYEQKNEEQGFDKHFDVDFGTFQERIKQMENPFVYAGEPELMALVDVVQHPIYVHQITHKIVLEKIVSKLLLLFISSIHLSKKLLLLHQSKLHTMIFFWMFFTLKLETSLQ